MVDEPIDSESFSKKWAEILNNNSNNRFMKLLSLLFTIIEPNASIDILVDFKNLFTRNKEINI